MDFRGTGIRLRSGGGSTRLDALPVRLQQPDEVYGPHGGYQYGGIKVNPYLYNGKEANTHAGVNLFDYGARMYDPAIGRWFVSDPLAEAAPGWTPYRYGFNNPMSYTDPTGMSEKKEHGFEFVKGGYGELIEKGSVGYVGGTTYKFVDLQTDLIVFSANDQMLGGYLETFETGSGKVISTTTLRSGRSFGGGGFGGGGGSIGTSGAGGDLFKSFSVASYWLGTAHAGLEIYADQKLAQNELQTLKRAKTLGSSRYGATTAIRNSNKYLNGMKIIGKGLAKPLFFAGVGISAIDVANGGSWEWAIADTAVGALGLGASAIGVALGAPVIGTAITIGAVGYFTYRIGSDIYSEFRENLNREK